MYVEISASGKSAMSHVTTRTQASHDFEGISESHPGLNDKQSTSLFPPARSPGTDCPVLARLEH